MAWKFFTRHTFPMNMDRVHNGHAGTRGVSLLYEVLNLLMYSRFSPVMRSKLKIIIIQQIKSRIWDTIDDWCINSLVKNQVFAGFHSCVICRSVSPRFIELCMEMPCLRPSEGHKYGGRKVTETSVTEFCYWNVKLWQHFRDPTHWNKCFF